MQRINQQAISQSASSFTNRGHTCLAGCHWWWGLSHPPFWLPASSFPRYSSCGQLSKPQTQGGGASLMPPLQPLKSSDRKDLPIHCELLQLLLEWEAVCLRTSESRGYQATPGLRGGPTWAEQTGLRPTVHLSWEAHMPPGRSGAEGTRPSTQTPWGGR